MSGPATAGRFVRLGAEHAEQTLAFISRLRDGLAEHTVPEWHGDLLPTLSWTLLCHLPPPSDGEGDVLRWRRRFRIGLCHYRQGPGFIQVKDLREEPVSLLLDDPVVVAVFLRCLRPTPLRLLTSGELEAVHALTAERLLVRLGHSVVTLPHRMKRWPVPAYAV